MAEIPDRILPIQQVFGKSDSAERCFDNYGDWSCVYPGCVVCFQEEEMNVWCSEHRVSELPKV